MDATAAEELLEKSAIRDFRLACLFKWGPEKSKAIIRDTGKRLERLAAELPADTDEKIREQLITCLLPALAYFQALCANGVPQAQAVEAVEEELERTAREQGSLLKSLLKLPFPFLIFRAVLRHRHKTEFPADGWQIKRPEGGVCGYNVERCFYKDTLERYGAAALLPAFCRREAAEFEVLEPALCCEIDRKEHLCAFRFYKGSRREPETGFKS